MKLAVQRLPFLLLGAASLLLGIGAGLVRIGWTLPPFFAQIAGQHAALMVVGFFGTLIALERAVALGRWWGYGAPPALALAALSALAGAWTLATGAAIVGSAVLLAVALTQAMQTRALHGWTLALGAASFACGTALWIHSTAATAAIPLWLAFFVFTIAGERLELARVLQPAPLARRLFIAALVLIAAGCIVAVLELDPAWQLLGAGITLLALWLARHDVARRTVRSRGLTRYIAVCLLVGYVWLALAGLLLLSGYGVSHAWDITLHALLIGFVLSMVFGHAPIIFPAVLRVKLPYTPLLYGALALLHFSLLLRVAGSALADAGLRAWGGLGHAAAIVLFALTLAGNAIFARPR